MKRELILLLVLLSVSFASAAFVETGCNLDVSLINQDPYPAQPGEYVKVVFRLSGIENPECGLVNFEVVQDYPFSLDPGKESKVIVNAGTYTYNYNSYLLIPYDLRVDSGALNDNYEVKVKYSAENSGAVTTKRFNISIDEVKTSFEVFVKDYDQTSHNLIIQILNTGTDDLRALTVEVPKQENLDIKGSRVYIMGDLDSNEDSNANFEAIPREGDIKIKIKYTDSFDDRKEVDLSAYFDPVAFQDRVKDQKATPWMTYIIVLAIIGFIVYRIVKSRLNKKKNKF